MASSDSRTDQPPRHDAETLRRNRKAAGFTLIEVLVVVAIIGVLMAILLPSMARARRSVIVLASPIAYIAKDGTLWVCGPNGEHQLQISNWKGFYGSVKWSPLGTRITCNYGEQIAVINPVTGQVDLLPKQYMWPIWVDSDNILAQHEYGGPSYELDLYKVRVPAGNGVLFKRLKQEGLPWGQVSGQTFASGGLLEGFALSEAEVNWCPNTDIIIRNKNWREAKTIWSDPGTPPGFGNIMDFEPRVDQFGENIAWTRGREGGYLAMFSVALKSLKAPSSEEPQILGGQFDDVWFCDWTSDNNLLATVTQNKETRLVVMNRRGQISRTIPTPSGMNEGRAFSAASWKRYEHR